MKETTIKMAEKAHEELSDGLKKAAEDYRRVLDNSLDIICQLDANGNFLEVSRASKRVWGYEPEELIGTSYWHIVHPDDNLKTIHATNNTKAGTPTSTFENRTIRKDGSVAYMMWSGYWSETDQIMYCVARDVSEIRLAETAREESETNYRALIESLPAIVCLADPFQPYKSKYVSPTAELFGYSVEEWMGRPDMWISLIHKDDRGRVLREAAEAMESGPETELEYRMVTQDGQTHWMRDKGQLIPDPEGVVNGWQRVITDVTNTKLAELASRRAQQDVETSLRNSEGRLRAIYENSPDCIKLISGTGELLDMNLAGLAMIEADSLDQVRGTNIYGVIASEDRNAYISLTERVFGGESARLEFDIVGLKGARRSLSTHAVPLRNERGEVEAVLGITFDLTEIKRAEAIRFEREQEFEALVENTPDIVSRYDDKFRHLYVNRAIEQATGMPASAYIGKTHEEMGMPSHLQAEWNAVLGDVFASGKERETEFEFPTPGGRRFYHSRLVPEHSPDGRIRSVLNIARDITDRKQAEMALRSGETLNRNLVEHLPQRIFIKDRNFRFLSCNASFAQDVGVSAEAVVGKDDFAFFSREIAEAYRADDQAVMDSGLLKDVEEPYQLHGKPRWVHTIKVPYRNDTGEVVGVLGIFEDITERKQAEAELSKSRVHMERAQRVAKLGSWETDLTTSASTWSEETYRIFEANVDSFQPTHEGFLKFVHPGDRAAVDKAFVDSFAKHSRSTIQHRLKMSDGRIKFVEEQWEIVRNSDGKPVTAIGTCQDITARTVAEASRRATEERLSLLFEQMKDGFYYSTPDGQLLDVNPAMIQMFGYSSREEMLKVDVPRDLYFSPEERISQTLEGGKDETEVFRMRRKDGSAIWVENRGQYKYDAEGNIEFHQGILRDVTERKLTEERLIRSEQRYRDLVENAHDIIYSHDLEGNYTSMNAACESVLGYTQDETLNLNLIDTVAPGHLEKAKEMMERKLKGEDTTAYELAILAKDGRAVTVEVNSKLIFQDGVAVGIQGIARDVTERKAAREQLEKSSAQLRIAGKAAHLGGWSIELPERTLTWTDENCIIHDVEPGYVPTLDESLATYYPEHRSEVMGYVNNCAKNGTPYDFELPIITAKGRHIWVRAIGEAVRDEDGKIVRLQGALQDITDRKTAEEALRQKESLIRIAGEVTRTGGWAVELSTNQVFWSDEISDILEFPRGEVPELARALELYPQPGRDKVVAGLEACSKDGTPLDMEVEIDTAAGRRIWVRLCAEADRKADGTITRIHGAFQDISDRKVVESQLRQAQKLESVGLLAGGIAHDFNNMLTAINGYTELTLRMMAEDDPLRRNLIEIKSAGERSVALTNQLLAFSRQQILQPEVVYINQIIADTGNMLERLIGENIRLVTILNPKVGQVKADPGQLSQILTNLAVNSRDAMPDGGKLTFETSNVFLDGEYSAKNVDVLPGVYVMIAVSDNGMGMDAETQEHIFEPFYTTKGIGKGTGLGLATVYGIVKQSNGHILVYSELGMGTTFKIYLPRVGDPLEEAETASVSDELPRGTETILLVEDEEMVRKFTRQTLEMCGYTVLEAGNGNDALAICESDPGRVHLVMTDIVMPGMGGRELAEKISLSCPEMPLLFTSGYTDDAVLRHGVVNSDANFIQKPFATEALARKVRDIFDAGEKL